MKHRTIIIPASAQRNAQALCKGLAGAAGDGIVRRRPVGLWRGARDALHQQRHDQRRNGRDAVHVRDPRQGRQGADHDRAGMPEAVPAPAAKAKISTTSQDHGARYSAIDVSDQDPHAAVARSGFEVCAGAAEMTAHAWFAAFVVVNIRTRP